ncbi:MAG: PKD domain-containing protein, partial [Flavobacteriales bacterium]
VSGGATITAWEWDLNANGSFTDASGPSIGFQFNAPGVYNVGLRITTDMDAPQSVYKLITVNPVPAADFTAPDVCEGTVSALADASTISSGSIATWEWDLDNDGLYDNATGSVIAHDFVNAGTYVVGLQVTSDQGCQSTTTENVTVDPMPTVEFAVAEVCLGDDTELTATSTVSSGTVDQYNWELNGNGLFDDATGTMITNQFSADGDYQVGLQVVSDQGCTIDTFQLMTIAPYPFVGFTFDNACQNTDVAFTNTTQNVVGTISYAWTFGSEGTSTEESPTFSFTSAGPASVELIGLTSFGCPDTVTHLVEVYPTPEADFTATEVCFGQTNAFTNTTDPKGATVSDYQWDFADGNAGFGANPFHEYFTADSFLVTMVANTTDGCRDTVQHYVHVWPLPTPVITADGPLAFCQGEDVTLTVNPNGVSNLWSTGETTQSITVDTTNLYEVLITDEHGCEGETNIGVISWLLPELTISNDTSISLGENIPLWVEGANFYDWTPSDYLDDPMSDMPTSIDPKENITYSVTGTDLNGCFSSISMSIEVITDYNLKP